ncbi:MAG TPA: DUF6580 family putative transport protein [Bacteroidia bacterium]|nr:DUF6580 family putative transport protein [Bacteroidia bacterium]
MNSSPKFLFITITIFLAALSRLLPHPFNFTPIGAMALFGGAYFSNKKLSFIIPLVAMFASDCLIGFHNTILYVYVSFILITFIGIFISNKINAKNIILASLTSSFLFFIISNLGVWMSDSTSHGMIGLFNTYFAAIPFYNNEPLGSFLFNNILGDLFFNGVLFGSYYLAKTRYPLLARA